MKFTISCIIILSSCFGFFKRGNSAGSILNNTENSIDHYDNVKTLNKFCDVLNEVTKHYEFDTLLMKFSTKKGKPRGFFIYDLVDTTNNSINGNIKFKEGHIYHFAPGYLYYSASNICILKDGKLIFFKGLNCKKNIDDIQHVVKWLRQHLPSNLETERIIDRTLNYRKYGRYLKVDHPRCKCENE